MEAPLLHQFPYTLKTQRNVIQYQRRRVESNLAAIMMGYVLVFLICNFPRLMLNIDELARIR